jgi:hypothetical protein
MADSPAREPAAAPALLQIAILWRIAAAFVAGLLLHAVFVFRFQSWAHRAQEAHGPVPLLVAMAVAGFFLVRRAPGAVVWVPLALTAGLLAGNAALIVVDSMKNPTAHERWLFEMFTMLLFPVPAWVGSLAARLTG